MADEPRVALLDDNLMFSASMIARLSAAGFLARAFAPTEAGVRELIAFAPAVTLVSLAAPGEWVKRLRQEPSLAAMRIVGYAGHLEAERLAAGRAAGADRVVANSALMSDPVAVVRSVLPP